MAGMRMRVNFASEYDAEEQARPIRPTGTSKSQSRARPLQVPTSAFAQSVNKAAVVPQTTVVSDALSLRGEKGEKGDKGDKGDRGDSYAIQVYNINQTVSADSGSIKLATCWDIPSNIVALRVMANGSGSILLSGTNVHDSDCNVSFEGKIERPAYPESVQRLDVQWVGTGSEFLSEIVLEVSAQGDTPLTLYRVDLLTRVT
jgi:hypothetical protein